MTLSVATGCGLCEIRRNHAVSEIKQRCRLRSTLPQLTILKVGALLFVAMGLSTTVLAQARSGNIYGTVSDEQGSELPGVGVTLMGCGAPRTTTTEKRGEFRFLNLAPCTYSIKTELSGFATVERDYVIVNI